jgi:predicted RNA-binding protein YlxR (DUF448 family)
MISKSSTAATRHIPKRTCIACRKTGGKRELVRIVRTVSGGVEVDLSGKQSGRGAYLCPDFICWNNALKSGKIEQALKTSLSAQDKEALVIYARGFDNIKQSSS